MIIKILGWILKTIIKTIVFVAISLLAIWMLINWWYG